MAIKKSGHVTLMDIATACACSVSTVSIVLSEAPLSQNVAETTRQKIRAMARQLGYHPDAFARSLRRRSSQTIGVLAYNLSDPYCIPIVRGIQAELQPASYFPLLMDAQAQRGLFESYLQMMLERRADGLIVIASWIFDETDLLADIEKNNVPIVVVSRDMTGSGVSSILIDNDAGGRVAMRHLQQLGHRKIAVIRGPEQLFDSGPRWAGVQQACKDGGIQLDPRLVLQLPSLLDPDSSFAGGHDCTRQMLEGGKPFTAVLAFDDLTALGVIRALTEAGLRVPEDCSVLGFDDVVPAAVATPGLTTIRQPLNSMGRLAAEWMLQAVEARVKGDSFKPRLHQAEPELVVRMSTARLVKKTRRPAVAHVAV